MRIAFDGVRLSKKPMGVTNIAISIINSYARLFPDFELFILMNGPLHPEVKARLADSPNITIVNRPLPVFSSIGFLWSILRFNKLLREIKPDMLIAPNFFVVTWFFPADIKLVLYVHDMVYKEYRSTMQTITRTQMDLFFETSLRRADMIWFNSDYTRQAFAQYYPDLALRKRQFTGAGINPVFLHRAQSPDSRTIPNPFHVRTGRRSDYILFVGTVEPRKNLQYLLRLYKQLPKGRHELVIVGDPGWGDMRKKIDAILAEENYPASHVHFMGYVSDDELIALYRDAAVFISTSVNEGLGLPQLEAMACGSPVICPHNSAMIEVVEGAGLTVKEWNDQTWIDAIEKVLQHRPHYIQAGFDRVRTYHWESIVPALHNNLISTQPVSSTSNILEPCN